MALTEAQSDQADVIDAILTYGTSLLVTREIDRSNFKMVPGFTREVTFIPYTEVSAIYPNMSSPFGTQNQGDLSNHDIFYCVPGTNIRPNVDSITYEGSQRIVTKVRTPTISGVVMVTAVYVMKDFSG